MTKETGLQPIKFEQFSIRRIWDEETDRWWFAVVDVVGALSDSKSPSKYWFDMKRREQEIELSANCRKFRMKAANGRSYQTECANNHYPLKANQKVL